MSDTILVLVRHLDDLDPARAVIAALPERQFTLSFGLEDLRTRFGDTEHATSVDPFTPVLNPQELSLVLCFAGAREPGASSNFLLLSYFDEIGIPTVELQRDLLRDPHKAQQESAARHYLPWAGAHGVGYLRLAPSAVADAVRDDVVLVTSHLAQSPFSEEQRYQFAFAVMRLAREHPQLSFLWRISPAEEQNAEAKLLLSMLGTSGPTNLWLEEHEPVDALLGRASAVICMAQTALLDYAASAKPVLTYVSPELEGRLSALSFTSFTTPETLLASWTELRSEPERFAVKCQMPRVEADKLRRALASIEGTRALREERRELTLRYLAYLQDARARADLGRLGPQINTMEKRLAELERLIGEQRKREAHGQRPEPRGKESRHLYVARRALKLVAQVKKRALKL